MCDADESPARGPIALVVVLRAGSLWRIEAWKGHYRSLQRLEDTYGHVGDDVRRLLKILRSVRVFGVFRG